MLLGFVPDASVFKQEAQKVMKHGAGCFTLIAQPVCFPNNRMQDDNAARRTAGHRDRFVRVRFSKWNLCCRAVKERERVTRTVREFASVPWSSVSARVS